MEQSWILVGMMGAGKSAIGRALAAGANREFIDTDLLLQHRFGRPIGQIFEVYGEEAFRDHETNILKSLEPGLNVISTGGGIVIRESNWTELQRLGITIYLNARIETLVNRLEQSKKKRPLLQVDDWESRLEELMAKREAQYRRADICVSVDDVGIAEAVAKVRSAIGEALK